MMFAPISASLSPNVQKDDVATTLRVLLRPTTWITGSARLAVEKWFEKYFGNSQVITFNSGRSALYAILRAFGLGTGDEVLVQAFTCVAVPNSVIWTGARPIYVDIDKSLNMDPADVERKITKKTRAIVVQHTFGVPASMDAILEIAKKNKLLVVEDCAHSLGATYKTKKVGTLGDAAAFSFGRDKVISSVFGGLAVVASGHKEVWKKLKTIHADAPYPSGFWILQQVLHPIVFAISLPLYRIGIGKAIIVALQKMGVLGFPVYSEEKEGKRPQIFPAKYPNALAQLLLPQLKKLDQFNAQRQANALLYSQKLKNKQGIDLGVIQEGAIYLRFPVFVENPNVYMKKFKRHGVLLGNWYQSIVDPVGTKFTKIFFSKASAPDAEYYASKVINLPTNISQKQALRIIKQFS
jgi:perosamine synthetase